MADDRFFDRAGPFTLGELARIAGADLADPATADRVIRDVAPLGRAGAGDLTFLDNKKYLPDLAESGAEACILAAKNRDRAPAGMALVISDKPYRGYAMIAQALYPEPAPEPGVHPTAVIAPGAQLADGVSVGPGAVIAAGAEIGPGTAIGANTVIGRGVVIGADGRIGANVTLGHCLIGTGVRILPGARIGQDGFGFAMDAEGHVKVPQLGRVIIGDRAEIGANVTIDRGAGPDTVIGDGVMIDNLVQIGHNVTVGQGAVFVAQSGVAGSSQIGPFAALAAQAGVAGHLTIGAGAKVAAKAGVMRDVPPGQEVVGAPAIPVRQFFRQQATLSRLAEKKTKPGADPSKGARPDPATPSDLE